MACGSGWTFIKPRTQHAHTALPAHLQNARPDGPASWVFKHITHFALRWGLAGFAHPFKTPAMHERRHPHRTSCGSLPYTLKVLACCCPEPKSSQCPLRLQGS